MGHTAPGDGCCPLTRLLTESTLPVPRTVIPDRCPVSSRRSLPPSFCLITGPVARPAPLAGSSWWLEAADCRRWPASEGGVFQWNKKIIFAFGRPGSHYKNEELDKNNTFFITTEDSTGVITLNTDAAWTGYGAFLLKSSSSEGWPNYFFQVYH